MAHPTDLWYVRLPSGKVVRARTTKALRYHIRTGRIPAQSRVRRSPDEDWAALEWTREVADVVPKSKANGAGPGNRPAASTPAPAKAEVQLPALRPLGVRGLVGELLSALDSSLNRFKLTTAAATGFSLGVSIMLMVWILSWASGPWALASAALIGLGIAVAFNLASSLVTQATFIELSRLRPARSKEIRAGLAGRTLRLLIAQGVVGSVLGLAIYALRLVPDWILAAEGEGLLYWLSAPLLGLALIFEAICWPLLSLTLLLAPILVIEDCSVAKALVDWWTLLRKHLGRLLTYEALALAVGVLVASPFVLPVVLTAWSAAGSSAHDTLILVRQCTLGMLGGVALAPFLAYMIVANTFIYLNLKYEFFKSAR